MKAKKTEKNIHYPKQIIYTWVSESRKIFVISKMFPSHNGSYKILLFYAFVTEHY